MGRRQGSRLEGVSFRAFVREGSGVAKRAMREDWRSRLET